MTDPSLLLQTALIEAGEHTRTAATLTLIALTDEAPETLRDTVDALPENDHPRVIAALARLSGIFLTLATGKDKHRAAAALRQIFPNLDNPPAS